ncbi:hypothetical protein YC2023_053522 [Brassica napus]
MFFPSTCNQEFLHFYFQKASSSLKAVSKSVRSISNLFKFGFDTELEAEGFSSGSTRGTIQRSSNQQPIREKITETDEGESGYKKGETKEKKRHTVDSFLSNVMINVLLLVHLIEKAETVWSQIEASLKQIEIGRTEVECFKALKRQEEMAATFKKKNQEEEVSKQKEREWKLHARYENLLSTFQKGKEIMCLKQADIEDPQKLKEAKLASREEEDVAIYPLKLLRIHLFGT